MTLRRTVKVLGTELVLRTDPELGLAADQTTPEAEIAACRLSGVWAPAWTWFVICAQRLYREGQLPLEDLELLLAHPGFGRTLGHEKGFQESAPIFPLMLFLHSYHGSYGMFHALQHPQVPIELQWHIVDAPQLSSAWVGALARNPHAAEAVLIELARNPQAGPQVLETIAECAREVPNSLFSRQLTTRAYQLLLARRDNVCDELLARQPHTPGWVIRRFRRRRDPEMQRILAEREADAISL